MNNQIRILTILLLVATATLLLAACGRGSSNDEPSEEGQSETAAEKTTSDESQSAEVDSIQEHAEGEISDEDGEAAHAEGEAAHAGSEEHSESAEDHMAAEHDVPADAAAVENPVQATEESIQAGTELFATTCAVCHGESGAGDGAAAAGLDPKPANLAESHVQDNTDGALFWIISKGREGTAMPPWEAIYSDDDRWHLVNYLRTFQEDK